MTAKAKSRDKNKKIVLHRVTGAEIFADLGITESELRYIRASIRKATTPKKRAVRSAPRSASQTRRASK